MTEPLHACLERYPGAALELDAGGVVLASNGRLDELTGREVIGLPLAALLDSSSRAKWSRILSPDQRTTPACTWELAIATPGSLEMRSFLALWGGGAAGDRLWLLEQAVDPKQEQLYSELSGLHRELVEAQRELGRERDRLRRAVARAQEAVRTRDEVLAVVSHDLRNPLDTITMAAGLLEMPLVDEKKAEQAQVIRRAARRMDRLIADLLDVSALESGRFTLERESVALGPLLDDAVRMYGEHAARRGQRLECEVSGPLPQVHGDSHRLLQVLSNLLGNAIKFTPEGGAVTLRAAPAGNEVVVEVRDNGPGIPEPDLPRIFDRFWHAGRRKHGGAGLGLAIVRGIVEAHEGRVWVESADGEGASFAFTLPVAGEPGKGGAPGSEQDAAPAGKG